MNRSKILAPSKIEIPESLVLEGDVSEILSRLPDHSVQCIITSPPYWGLRDYGIHGQIGLEPTLAAYIHKLTGVFTELRRILSKCVSQITWPLRASRQSAGHEG